MPNDVVTDPLMGSGTTGFAALNLNRKFVGIEKDTRAFEIARTRIDSYSLHLSRQKLGTQGELN
jgi:DNA modification methylase